MTIRLVGAEFSAIRQTWGSE